MARPRLEGTNYKVTIHKNGRYMYASTQPLLVDKATGKTFNRRMHWGAVDSDKKFHPGKTYIYAEPSERDKLIFPADWDMSEAMALKSNRIAGRPKSLDSITYISQHITEVTPHEVLQKEGSQCRKGRALRR